MSYISFNFDNLPKEMKRNVLKFSDLSARLLCRELNGLAVENLSSFINKLEEDPKYLVRAAERLSWSECSSNSDESLKAALFFRKMQRLVARDLGLDHTIPIISLHDSFCKLFKPKSSKEILEMISNKDEEGMPEFFFCLLKNKLEDELKNFSTQDLGEIIKYLINKDSEFERKIVLLSTRNKDISSDVIGESIKIAAQKNQIQTVILLLDFTNAKDVSPHVIGESITTAARNDQIEIVTSLLAFPESKRVPVEYFQQALKDSQDGWDQFKNRKEIYFKLAGFVLGEGIVEPFKTADASRCSIM